jgi:uncharacterized protein
VAGARRLRTAFQKLTARATICAGTDPFTVRHGLEEAGFAYYSLTPASPVILNELDGKEDTVAREAATEQMLAYQRKKAAELFSAINAHDLDANSSPEALVILASLATGEKRYAGCGIGRGMRAVSVDGGIFPCHRFVGLADTCMGDLDSYKAEGLNDYHRAVVDHLPECRSCWARYFCGGGCFYVNRSHTGEMDHPDPLFCREVRTVLEDYIAGWCQLSDADRDYAREQIKKTLEKEDRLP